MTKRACVIQNAGEGVFGDTMADKPKEQAKRPTNIKYDMAKYEKHSAFVVMKDKAGKAYAMRHKFRAPISAKFVFAHVPADIKMSAETVKAVKKKLVEAQKEVLSELLGRMKGKELSKDIVNARRQLTPEELKARVEAKAEKARQLKIARAEAKLASLKKK
jgi:hypothetical protein